MRLFYKLCQGSNDIITHLGRGRLELLSDLFPSKTLIAIFLKDHQNISTKILVLFLFLLNFFPTHISYFECCILNLFKSFYGFIISSDLSFFQ